MCSLQNLSWGRATIWTTKITEEKKFRDHQGDHVEKISIHGRVALSPAKASVSESSDYRPQNLALSKDIRTGAQEQEKKKKKAFHASISRPLFS